MFNSQQLQTWRNKNLYYYQDLENLCKFFVQPDSSVLDVGAKLGHLLAAVKPSYGLGIDSNPSYIEKASEKYPHFNFETVNPEEFISDYLFDYILLANSISSFDNIQQVFTSLNKVCFPSTRLIITFHNPAWELILRIATMLKQRMPLSSSPLNWLNLEKIFYTSLVFRLLETASVFYFRNNSHFCQGFLINISLLCLFLILFV